MNELNEIVLIYIGDGRKLANIPARDLTQAEVNRYAGKNRLIKTGLWIEPEQKPAPKKRTYRRKKKEE